ncbi:HXXEE domain-containing protein [Rhodoblastus sp.]|jgi:hypothetical protein|uniref:HXXEE domain-containing protein n=1 Tax=Rhodoblastus sp. TaxID=1962975 RepID=UPI0025CE1E0E|nr:HXXEE domain-containing protein [Rhodoblastus sp.]
MTMTTLAWLGMAAYAMHILEEYALDWLNWSRNVLGLPTEWNDFYVTNCVVIALGIAQAMLAPTLPLAVLGFSGLQFINAVLMHVTPVIRTGGRFSPGVVTGVLLFLPLSIATYWTAWTTGVATLSDLVLGLVIGGATLAFPIVMLKVKSWPYFRQA